MEQPKADIGLNLLFGLDEEKDKEWLADIKSYHDRMISKEPICYPCFPLVKNKRVRLEVHLMAGEIFLVLERKLGDTTTGIKLSLNDFEKVKEKFGLIQDVVKANQLEENNWAAVYDLLHDKDSIKTELYGWKYCRIPVTEDIMLTFKWHEGKHFTLIKFHRGVTAESGIWVPDANLEICLGGGGIQYLMHHLTPKIEEGIAMWKKILEVANPAPCMYSFLTEEEEVDNAIAALLEDAANGVWEI